MDQLVPTDTFAAAANAPEESNAQETAKAAQNAALPKEDVTSLNTEIDQVKQNFGSFGTSLTSFWGSVRKQGASAYSAAQKELETRTDAARKDFAPYLEKAKEEYSRTREEVAKLGEQLKQQAASTSPLASPSEQAVATGNIDVPATSFYGEIMTPTSAGNEKSVSPSAPAVSLPSLAVPASATAFLSKIQSQVQPMQSRLSTTLQNVNVPNLNSLNLDQTSKFAESYVQKATPLFQQASKDVGKFFENAVKVVPPDELAASQYVSASDSRETPRTHKDEGMSTAALSRTEALLLKLQTNKAILLVDPSADLPSPLGTAQDARALADSRSAYEAFLESVKQQGGLYGETYKSKIADALAPKAGVPSPLQSSLDALVPSKLTRDEFFSRYFFRKQQIEDEDTRRKQVLQSAEGDAEDDFSWDNEEEDTPNTSTRSVSTPTKGPATDEAGAKAFAASIIPASESRTEAETSSPVQATSARNSSEEGTMSSYDVLSTTSRSAAPSSGVNSDAELVKKAAKDGQAMQEEDNESDDDWE